MRQLFGLLNEAGIAMAKRGDIGWQSLMAEWTFVTVAAETQTNTPIPTDFAKFVPDSFFNRTQQRKLIGPLTPQQYQAQKARPSLVAPYLAYRERAGTFLMDPTPDAGDTIAYEYVSSYWAKSSAGVAKAQFTSDDDTTYLDEELLTLDLKWRWKQAKGLEYGEDMQTAEREIMAALGEDGGATMLDAGGPRYLEDLTRYNLPEGGFGI
uniref:phage adaptor protein n=1 Tax=Phenylobacterium soli TaxID=2170551 RepID=UPI0010580DE9|nr:hypothetical protein [Phenylobacterium soli]